MKIKTKFRIVVTVFLVIAIVLCGIIFLTVKDTNEAMEKNKISKIMVKDVFELNIVSHDYIMYHEERPKMQWQSKYDSVEVLLIRASEKFKDPEEQAIVKDIRQSHENLEDIFSQLVTNYEKQNINEEENATFLELEERLITQLKVKSLHMVSLADQLSGMSHKEVMTAQERVNSFTIIFIVFLSAIMVTAFVWIGRCVLKPLTQFQMRYELIAKGNWDYKVGITKRDEIGDLAKSFDNMRLSLKKSINEIEGARNNLEIKVKERTKELLDTQEQLVRNEKLAILGKLAGGVSHELRNPLGAIKNAGYFLNMVIENPEPEVKESLEILDREVATSESIISSLLDFARTKPPTPQKVNITEVVRKSLNRISVPKNIEVVNQLDPPLPTIMADPNQLDQVFVNLILNGIQAMPESGGRLVVKSEVKKPDWIAVSVTDTGEGIPEENMEKLFEPLFTAKAKGIGLGLAISKTLVEGNNGTIEVKSKAGVGSTFTVNLPTLVKEVRNER